MRFITAHLLAARSRCTIVAAGACSPSRHGVAGLGGDHDRQRPDGFGRNDACGVACTGVGTAFPGRTIASPITGVVVRWRIGDGVGQLTFRVARPAADTYPGDDTHTGVGRSAPVTVTTPPSNGVGEPPVISTFPTRVSIGAGDHIGVDLTPTSGVGVRDRAGSRGRHPSFRRWAPASNARRRNTCSTTSRPSSTRMSSRMPIATASGTRRRISARPTQTTQGLCRGPLREPNASVLRGPTRSTARLRATGSARSAATTSSTGSPAPTALYKKKKKKKKAAAAGTGCPAARARIGCSAGAAAIREAAARAVTV